MWPARSADVEAAMSQSRTPVQATRTGLAPTERGAQGPSTLASPGGASHARTHAVETEQRRWRQGEESCGPVIVETPLRRPSS